MAGKLVNSSPGLIVFNDRVFGRRGRTFACLHENAVKGRSPMPISSREHAPFATIADAGEAVNVPRPGPRLGLAPGPVRLGASRDALRDESAAESDREGVGA